MRPFFFTSKQLLIRKITAGDSHGLYSTYVEEECYNNPSIINVVLKDTQYSLKYLLAIINSKVISWFHYNSSPKARKGLFPKILVNDVKKLPIPQMTKEGQKPLVALADQMLALQKELQERRKIALSIIESEYRPRKMSRKIISFHHFDGDVIVEELERQGVKLTLFKKDQLYSYFFEKQKELIGMEEQIKEIDYTIDGLVYQLFSLTEEEIDYIE